MLWITIGIEPVVIGGLLWTYSQYPLWNVALAMVGSAGVMIAGFTCQFMLRRGQFYSAINLFLVSALIAVVTIGLGVPDDLQFIGGLGVLILSYLVIALSDAWRRWLIAIAIGYVATLLLREGIFIPKLGVVSTLFKIALPIAGITTAGWLIQITIGHLRDSLRETIRLRDEALEAKSLEYRLSEFKSRILTTINHEFRTPLTYISGYGEMLLNTDVSEEEKRDMIRGVVKGADRLGRLVDGFLFLVALQASEARASYRKERENFSDWSEIIRRSVSRNQGRINGAPLNLEIHIEPRLPLIAIHTLYIELALSNLISNAVKFTPNGQVVLRVEPWRRGVQISVADTGIGIAAEKIPQLFGMMEQIDRDKMEQQGTGIGLSVVKGIIDLHGGQIDVESKPGYGTTVTIRLPGLEGLHD